MTEGQARIRFLELLCTCQGFPDALRKGLGFLQSHMVGAWVMVFVYIKTNKQKVGKLGNILVTSVAVTIVRTFSAYPLGSLRCQEGYPGVCHL